MVYANTSAEVKALADWMVTSSNAVDIINHLQDKGEKILWAPDKYLGITFNAKPVLTCFYGTGRVLCTKHLRLMH